MSSQMSKYSNKMLLITAFAQGASNLSELRAKSSKISVCIHIEVEWQISLPKLSQVQKIAPPLMSFLRAFSVIEVFCHDDLTYFNEFLFKF